MSFGGAKSSAPTRLNFLKILSVPIVLDGVSAGNLTIRPLKHALRLALYLAGVILLGALIAPILFWSAQTLARHDGLTFLGQFEFEQFFHRALLVSALAFLWPLLRSLDVRRPSDLGLRTNPH